MSISNVYSKIPISYGKNLFILGTANKGKSNEPVQVYNLSQCKELFGDLEAGNLIKAFKECYLVAQNNINYYLIRIFDTYSTITLKGYDYRYKSFTPLIKLYAKEAGIYYNNIYITVTDKGLIINQDNLNNPTVLYSYSDYKTIYDFLIAINKDENILIYGDSQLLHASLSDIYKYYKDNDLLNIPLYMTNTRKQLCFTKNQLYIALDETYDILIGQPIDILYVPDIFVDDINPREYKNKYGNVLYQQDRDYLTLPDLKNENKTVSFHKQMIDFCKKQFECGIATHGVIGFNNPQEYTECILFSKPYLSKALFGTCFSSRDGLIEKNNNTIIDGGKYISIVCGELEYENYYNSGASAYASILALNSKLDSLTNTTVPYINNIRYHLDDEQLIELSKLGIVTFRYSLLKQAIVINNAVTAQMYGSPYCNVSNMRMIQTIICYFKEVLEQYIGQNILKLSQTTIIQDKIAQLVDLMIYKALVKDLKYNVSFDINNHKLYLELNILALNSLSYISSMGEVKV